MSSLTSLLIPTFKQNLRSLSSWLDKAADDETLNGRLAPDMFPLATQVRFVCVQAEEAVYRLQRKQIPQAVLDLAQEGRSLSDAEKKDTIGAAKAQIQQTLDFLEALEPDALDQGNSAERSLAVEPGGGLTFDMTGEQYARDWALPQFYFHTVVAYSILRSAGLPLGKADYVPHMFAYLRPQVASSAAEQDTHSK